MTTMSRTIARPKPVARRKAEFVELPVKAQPETIPVSKSRSDVEVWNSTFPRRAWLEGEAASTQDTPQVRPAGHEREGAAPAHRPSVEQILGDIERACANTATLAGLCRTCVRLSDCTYPKPEGGVWHCDEHE